MRKRLLRSFIFWALGFSLLGLGACGGSSESTGEESKLTGTWISQEADAATGYRLLFNFKAGKDSESFSCLFSIVGFDGKAAASLKGQARLQGNKLELAFEGMDSIAPPYELSGDQLTLDGTDFKRLQGDPEVVEGQGGIAGKLRVPESGLFGLEDGDFVPGELIVQWKDNHAAPAKLMRAGSEFKTEIPALGVVLQKPGMRPLKALALNSGKPFAALVELVERREWTKRQVAEYRRDPNVRWAQPNYILKPLAVPNDPHYALQWHYEMIHLESAWDITQGSDDIIVGVVDTGVRLDHPDLAGRLTDTGYDFISDPARSRDGDGIDADPMDEGDNQDIAQSSWHGTHVAGTIGAASDNGLGVAGVTWAGKIMPVRVMGIGGGTSQDIANGILYAAGLSNVSGQLPPQRANVINLSLGTPSKDFLIDGAVNKAFNAGVVVVSAAGNTNSSKIGSPATAEGSITVSSVSIDGKRAPYSCFGPEVDVTAPGGNSQVDVNGDGYVDGVLSTWWDAQQSQPAYYFMNGTSMAAPHVAGVAALLLSVNPNLNPAQIETLLTQTATDLGVAGRDDEFGSGLIHVPNALAKAQGIASEPPSLQVSPAQVQFVPGVNSRDVLIANAGGGSLTNIQAKISQINGGNWLSLQLSPQTSQALLTLSVNPAGLNDGQYDATVEINSSAGTKSLPVTLKIGGAGTLSGSVYVAAIPVDNHDGGFVQQTNGQLQFQYQFSGLPVGQYVIAALTDGDGDGEVCEAGDLCGYYPTPEQPSIVPVFPDLISSGIDFSIGKGSVIQSVDESLPALSSIDLANFKRQ